MKQGLIFPALFVVAASVALPTSAKADDAEDFFRFYSWFQASWKGEVEENGKKQTVSGKYSDSGGRCNIYVGTGETSVWGYDPKHKTWTGVGHLENGSRFIASECPLAASHIVAGMELLAAESKEHKDGASALPKVTRAYHPIELFARAYELGK